MKVYIIDDEEVNIFLTRKKLISAGLSEDKDIHAFLFAKDALSSLFKCSAENLPDVVLLDINMPEMDGWQFLDALAPFKSRFKEIRIYILTSSLALSDEAIAKDNSMVAGFIRKPISDEDFRKFNPQSGGL
jgi:CheY-like chemotaxis protein